MAHSYLEYRGDGFFANDIDIHVLVGLLISSAKRGNMALRTGIVNAWNESLSQSGSGAIDLELDDLIGDDISTLRQICAIIAAAKEYLAAFGGSLTSDQLNVLAQARVQFVGARKAMDYAALLDKFGSIIQCPR